MPYSAAMGGLAGNVNVKGRLGCNNYEMVEYRILRRVRRVKNKLTDLDVSKVYFGLFKYVFRMYTYHIPLLKEGRITRFSNTPLD